MAGLESSGSPLKVFNVLQSNMLIMLGFLPLVLVALALPYLATVMPTSTWHAPSSACLEGPAFAFLLVNCVIVTIIASSKLESEKRGQKEGRNCKGETMGQVDGKEDESRECVEDQNVIREETESHHIDTPSEKGYDDSNNSGENGIGDENYGSIVEDESVIGGIGEKRQGDENGYLLAETVIGEIKSQSSIRPIKKGYVDLKNNRGNFLIRRSLSLNAAFVYKNKHKPVWLNLKEKKRIRKTRLESTRNHKVKLLPDEILSTDHLKLEKQIFRGSLIYFNGSKGPHHEKLAPENSFYSTAPEKSTNALGCHENFIKHPPPQADYSAPATTAAMSVVPHPSLEEVWASITMSNKNHDRMACTPAQQGRKMTNSKSISLPKFAAATDAPTQPAAAAALGQPAAVSHRPPPAAAAAAADFPLKAATAAEEKHVKNEKPVIKGNGPDNDGELEELNRRAEQFIHRFNRQMRLQREESLQRQKRQRRRPCNYDRMLLPYPLLLPAGGQLVG